MLGYRFKTVREHAREMYGWNARELADIRPPEATFEDWLRFINEWNEKGGAKLDERERFAGPMGMALLKRWRWVQDARARGLTFTEASIAFDAMIERERDSFSKMQRDRERQLAKAIEERNEEKQRGRRRGRAENGYQRDGDDLWNHAEESGLFDERER